MTVHPFIEAEKRAGHSVKRACELMKVSRTAFYARRSGLPGPRAVRDAELTEQITEVHARSRGTYGAPRVHAVLTARLQPPETGARSLHSEDATRSSLGWVHTCGSVGVAVLTAPFETETRASRICSKDASKRKKLQASAPHRNARLQRSVVSTKSARER
ncbi:IS3 family transposase [Streptomyces sp. NPDC048211]|uniref:IS3 family transposase n=1 Tax=Streptomyces sp. NPDC048211 TaxID=3365516 RepID=UPI00371549A4